MVPSLSKGDLTRDDLVNAAIAAQGLGGDPFSGGSGGGGAPAGFAAYTFDFSNEASYNAAAGTFAAKSGSRYIEVLNGTGTSAKTGTAFATLCPTHSGLGVPAIKINASTGGFGLGLTTAVNPLVAELSNAAINANGGGYYVVVAGLVSKWNDVTGSDGAFYFLQNAAFSSGNPDIKLYFLNYAGNNVQGVIDGFDTERRTYYTADIPTGALTSESANLPPAYRMRVAIKHLYGTVTEFKVRTDTIDVTENTSATIAGGTKGASAAKTFKSLVRGVYGDHLTYRVKNFCIVPFVPGKENASAYAQAIADADSSLWFL